LIPAEGQLPDEGAAIGIKVPSIIDPCKLKYQEIEMSVLPLQVSMGAYPPEAFSNAEVSWEIV